MLPGSRRFPRCVLGVIAVMVLALPGTAQAREAVWTRIWGTPDADFANAVALDSAYNSVVVGYTYDIDEPSATLDDAWVRSHDAHGTLRWSHEIVTAGYDAANDVAVDHAGNSYVVGSVNGALPGQTLTGIADAYIRKYDAAGVEFWTRQFGFAGMYTSGDFVVVDADGGIYLGGSLNASDPNLSFQPILLRKYDPDGNELWTDRSGRSAPPSGVITGMTFTAGTLYVAGDGLLEGNPAPHGPAGFLKAFAPDGTELWSHEDRTNVYVPNDLASNASGRIAETGWVYHPDYTVDIYLRLYDTAGNVIWTKRYNDGTDDLYHGLAVDDAGNIFIGRTKLDTGDDGGAAQLTRFNADGTPAWKFVIDPTPPNSVVADLLAPQNGALYVVGAADGDFAGAKGIEYIDAYLLELNQLATCAGTSRPEGNEEGMVSASVHQSVEPMLPAPLNDTAHNLNCNRIEPNGF